MGTWGSIKLKTLQKMFSTNGGQTTIPNDNATREFVSAMPGACNEALQLLATAGKFIIKSLDIAHIPVRNLVSNGDKIQSTEGGSISYEGDGARSFYYELKGKGTMTLVIGDREPIVELFDTLSDSQGFVPFKRIIPNPEKAKVSVTFESEYPMALKNVAFYSAKYEFVDQIPPYSEYIRYDLTKMVDDYYMVDLEHIIYEGDADISRYTATSDFFQEGFKVMVLHRDIPGNYKIYYKAYPQQITNETGDDVELSLDPEVEALLPLYMASQLYKDDDLGMATGYRNEFEVAFERLTQSVSAPSSERFTSESGWI